VRFGAALCTWYKLEGEGVLYRFLQLYRFSRGCGLRAP
jgi:hypothetical protein